MTIEVSPWFVVHAKPQADMRLFCFPFAGGSSTSFRGWEQWLPDRIEQVVVELPGRGRRFGESPCDSLSKLIVPLADAIEVSGGHFAFFGHSLGALICFELTRELRRRGSPLPEFLAVSAKRAPHIPTDRQLHLLSDAKLVNELQTYNGTPAAVLGNEELMELFLPILRADFSLAECYQHQPEPPMDIPIHALGGDKDMGVTVEQLRAWQKHTTVTFSLKQFPGGHFYHQEDAAEAFVAHLNELLTPGSRCIAV